MVPAHRRLDPSDRLDLDPPQPVRRHRTETVEPGPQRTGLGVVDPVPQPTGQRLGPVEGDHLTRAGFGVEPVGEHRLVAGRLVQERQRRRQRRQVPWEPRRVLRGLRLHARQRRARRLRFHGADRLAIHEQQVVDPAVPGGHDELPDCHPLPGVQVEVLAVLHHPAARDELPVDLHPGARLPSEVALAHREVRSRHNDMVPTRVGGPLRAAGLPPKRLPSPRWPSCPESHLDKSRSCSCVHSRTCSHSLVRAARRALGEMKPTVRPGQLGQLAVRVRCRDDHRHRPRHVTTGTPSVPGHTR